MATIKKVFGNKIRLLRTKQNLSQERFALKIEMDRSYYASVENGKRNISLENIYKIAKGLGVKLEDLFRSVD